MLSNAFAPQSVNSAYCFTILVKGKLGSFLNIQFRFYGTIIFTDCICDSITRITIATLIRRTRESFTYWYYVPFPNLSPFFLSYSRLLNPPPSSVLTPINQMNKMVCLVQNNLQMPCSSPFKHVNSYLQCTVWPQRCS